MHMTPKNCLLINTTYIVAIIHLSTLIISLLAQVMYTNCVRFGRAEFTLWFGSVTVSVHNIFIIFVCTNYSCTQLNMLPLSQRFLFKDTPSSNWWFSYGRLESCYKAHAQLDEGWDFWCSQCCDESSHPLGLTLFLRWISWCIIRLKQEPFQQIFGEWLLVQKLHAFIQPDDTMPDFENLPAV